MTLIATRPTEYPCKRFMCSNFQQTMGHLAKLEQLLLIHRDIGRRGKVFRNVNSDLPYLSSVQPKTQFRANTFGPILKTFELFGWLY